MFFVNFFFGFSFFFEFIKIILSKKVFVGKDIFVFFDIGIYYSFEDVWLEMNKSSSSVFLIDGCWISLSFYHSESKKAIIRNSIFFSYLAHIILISD